MEDRWARDFLIGHMKSKLNAIAFTDYSLHEPFDEAWKTHCRARIARTKGTIVLVGPHTFQSEAVVWEIEETIRKDHPVFGIQIHRDLTHRKPRSLPAANVIRWEWAKITRWLDTWR
jgi:hypothetical protein